MQFLLAAGEGDVGGLGWREVKRLSIRDLNLLWYMQRRVLQSHSKEGREAIEQDRAAALYDLRDAAPVMQGERPPGTPPDPIDYDHATPEKFAAWQRAWQQSNVHG